LLKIAAKGELATKGGAQVLSLITRVMIAHNWKLRQSVHILESGHLFITLIEQPIVKPINLPEVAKDHGQPKSGTTVFIEGAKFLPV